MNIFTTLLTQPLANGLILFYNVFGHNMGFAIIFFSIFLIFIMRPLTKPYMESMKKIKALQPQIDKLKKKYGTDKAGFSKAQAELYKQTGVNPAQGCLPMIFQFAILIALFGVFTKALSSDNSIANLNNLLYGPLKFNSDAVLNTKFLWLDVTKPDVFRLSGISFALPGIFVILAAVAQFVSVKITMPFISAEAKIAQKTKSEVDDMQVAMQSSMVYMGPLMTLYFGTQFASGLALYWFIYSFVTAIQQIFVSGWGGLTPFVSRLGFFKSSK